MGQVEAEREVNKQLKTIEYIRPIPEKKSAILAERNNARREICFQAEQTLREDGTYKESPLATGIELLINFKHAEQINYLEAPPLRIKSAEAKIWLMQRIDPGNPSVSCDGFSYVIAEKDGEKPTLLFTLHPNRVTDANGELKTPKQFSKLSYVLNFYQKAVRKLNSKHIKEEEVKTKHLAASKTLYDEFEIPPPPKKQNLSDEELDRQNIKGYATLAQAIFGIYPSNEEHDSGIRIRRNLLRKRKDLDPLITIGIDNSRIRDLVEGVELAISGIYSVRIQQTVRLYFCLDQMELDSPISLEAIGREVKDIRRQRPITKERARQLIYSGLRMLRHPSRSRYLRARLWGDKTNL